MVIGSRNSLTLPLVDRLYQGPGFECHSNRPTRAGSTCSSTNRKIQKTNPDTCFSNGVLILSIHWITSLKLHATFAQLRFRDAAISPVLLCNALFLCQGE